MRRFLGLLVLTFLLLAPPAWAGPPCICWEIEIGASPSLPWGEAEIDRDEGQDPAAVVPDTLSLLDADLPVLARMETLRRAVLYIENDRERQETLLLHLTKRVVDATAGDASDSATALALFDAGYAVACFRQLGVLRHLDGVSALDGVGWLEGAIGRAGGDPAMHFAAALATLDRPAPDFEAHAAEAMAGADGDPLLARNLKTFADRAPALRRYVEGRAK